MTHPVVAIKVITAVEEVEREECTIIYLAQSFLQSDSYEKQNPNQAQNLDLCLSGYKNWATISLKSCQVLQTGWVSGEKDEEMNVFSLCNRC